MAKSKIKTGKGSYKIKDDDEDISKEELVASPELLEKLFIKLNAKSDYLETREGGDDLTSFDLFLDNLMKGLASEDKNSMIMVADLIKFAAKQDILNQEAALFAKHAEDKAKEIRYALLNALSLFGYLSFADFHKFKERYNISLILLEGGRYSGKTYDATDYVLMRVIERPPLVSIDDMSEEDRPNFNKINEGRGGQVFCGRAVEGDVEKSVFAVIENRIVTMGLSKLFEIKKSQQQIVCKTNGVVIHFTGFNKLLDDDNEGMKGWENAFLVWTDEAQSLSFEILQKVYNTIIRTKESILLMTMNRRLVDDPAYIMATETYKESSYVQKFCYLDNVFLDEAARKLADSVKNTNPTFWRQEYLGEPNLSFVDSYWDASLLGRMKTSLLYKEVKHSLSSVVIGIDPAGTDSKTKTANEWGLIAIGKTYDDDTNNEKYYLLDDFSGIFKNINDVFMLIVVKCLEYDCRTLIFERNGVGQAMASFDSFIISQKNLGKIDFDFYVDKQGAWASGKKEDKHKSFAEYCQRGSVFFLADRPMVLLENQMQLCTVSGFKGKNSPDRVDAATLAIGHLGNLKEQTNVNRIFKLSMFSERPLESEGWEKLEYPVITFGCSGVFSSAVVYYLFCKDDDVKAYVIDYDIFETSATYLVLKRLMEIYPKSAVNLEDNKMSEGLITKLTNSGVITEAISLLPHKDDYRGSAFINKVAMIQPYIFAGFISYPVDLKHVIFKEQSDNWIVRDFISYDVDKKSESPIIKAIANVIQGVYAIDG